MKQVYVLNPRFIQCRGALGYLLDMHDMWLNLPGQFVANRESVPSALFEGTE